MKKGGTLPWHANLKGKLNGSREVVLFHRAI
jgi:hypothetical protein